MSGVGLAGHHVPALPVTVLSDFQAQGRRLKCGMATLPAPLREAARLSADQLKQGRPRPAGLFSLRSIRMGIQVEAVTGRGEAIPLLPGERVVWTSSPLSDRRLPIHNPHPASDNGDVLFAIDDGWQAGDITQCGMLWVCEVPRDVYARSKIDASFAPARPHAYAHQHRRCGGADDEAPDRSQT